MGRSSEKFIQHREDEQRRDAQELAAREAAYLNRNQSSQRDTKTKQDGYHTSKRTSR